MLWRMNNMDNKKMVYVVSFIRSIDPYETPQAVLRSQRAVAKFLDVPLRNVQRQFENGCNIAYFGRWQIEKIYLNNYAT